MNPVAMVTGASRGIGRGTALELAKAGRDLIINFAGNEAAAKQTVIDCMRVGWTAWRCACRYRTAVWWI